MIGSPSRRSVLVGALGVLGAAAAGCTTGGPTGRFVSGSFRSAKRHGAVAGWSIAYPPGHDGTTGPLPVLVALHGRGGDHTSAFGGELHLDGYLADATARGVPPFAIASVDGGDHSYRHPRRDGDSAGMVIDEFVPLLARRGLDTSRIGLLGWSMGGYGALYLATVLGRRKVGAVVAESPAMWREPWQSAAGAFDDAADFRAHDVLTRLDRLTGIPLRIDCGASDGFAPITRELRAALSPRPAGGIEPGGHDDAYWRSQAPAQLKFVGAVLHP